MQSVQNINMVVDYIEQNIGKEIDEKMVASIAGCSFAQFQRVFSFMAGISLSEYLRRRRLSMCAVELLYTGSSILDIAVKYGYETASGFSRAFKAQHSATPSQVQTKQKQPQIFDRIFFISPQYAGNKTYRFKEGSLKTAKLINISFKPFKAYKVVGRAIETRLMSNDIPMRWGRFFSDGSYSTLLELCKEEKNLTTLPDAYTGVMYNFREDGKITYLVGITFAEEVEVPEGFDSFTIPAGMMAESWIEGEEYEIYSQGHELTVTAIESAGYTVDWERFFQCEVYTDERFDTPKKEGKSVVVLDYYIPIKQ